MKIIVMYDVSDNKKREFIAKKLLSMGLVRIQRSVFVGRANPQLIKDVERLAAGAIDPERDVIHITPIDDTYWRRMKVFGKPYYLRDNVGGCRIV